MAAVEQRLPHGLLSPPLGKSSLSLTLHLARKGRFQAVEISGGKLSSSKDEKSEALSALMQRLRTKSAQIKSWSDTSKLVRSMVWTSLNDKRAVDNLDHSRLRKCINALQKALKVTTLPSMVERLDSVARQVGLNFKVTSSGHECCISSELFYVEIRLDTSGGVQDVRVAHHGSESQSCPEMLRVLRNGDFKEFVGHLKGLQNIYRIPGDSKIKMRTYQTLLCMESDLTKMADAYNRMSGGRVDPMTQIQKGIVGYVIPRQGGHPMQLKCFISPYDMLNVEREKSETIRDNVPRDVGQSVNVALEGSTSHKLQTQPLFAGMNPPQHDSKGPVGTPAFAGINNNNMMLLPACFSLAPPSPIPLSLSTIKRIHSATGILCGDESKAVPMNRLVTQNVMEAKGIADMDNNNGRNKLFHVTLPDQHHCYYINDSPDVKGVLVSKIPFTHPACVPRVLEALRRQTVYNTLITSCVRKGCEEAKENAQLFEVNTTSPTGISVTFEHPVQESMACLEIDLADPNHVKCKVHIPAGDAPVCTDEYATMVMNRCLSIPVLMRAIARHAVAHHKEMQRQISTTSAGILSSLSKATEGIVMSHGFSEFAAVTSPGLKIAAVKDGNEQKLSNANLNLLGVTSPGGGGKAGGTLLMHLNGVDPSQGNDFGGAAAQYRQASVSPFTLASTTTGRGAQAELQFTDTDATKVSENPMLASLLKGSLQGPPHSKSHPMLMNLLKEPVGVPPQPGQMSPRGTEPPPPTKQRKRKRKSTTDNRSPKRQQSEEEFTKELNAMDFDSNIPYDATLQADHLTPTTPHPSTPTVQSPARAFPHPPSHSMQLKPSLDPSGRGEAVKDFTQDSEVSAMLNDIAEQSERLKRQGSRDGANSRLSHESLPPLDSTGFIRTDGSMEDLTAAGAVAPGGDLQAAFDPADFVAGESTPGTDHLDTDYTFPTEPIEFNTEVLNTTDTSFVDSLIEESSEGNVSMDVESCDANAFGLALNPTSVASKIATSGTGSSDVSGKSQAATEVVTEAVGSVSSNVGSALSASSFDQGPFSGSDLQGLDLSMTAASTPEVLDLSTGHHTPLDQQTEPTDLSTSQKSSSSTSLQQLEPTDLSTSLKLPSAIPPSSTATASAASVPSSSGTTSSASITQQSTGSLKITLSLGNNMASIKSGKSDSEGSRSDGSTKVTKRRSSSRSSAEGSNGAEGSGKRSRAGDKKDKGSKRRRSEAGVSPPRAAGVGPNGSRTPPVSKTFTPPYSTSPARSYTPPASLPGASSQLPMATPTARSHTPPASMQSSRSGSGGKPAAMLSLQAKTVGAIGKSGSLGGGKSLSGTGSASPMRTKALSKSLSEGSGKGGQSPRSKSQVSGSGSKSSSSKDKPSRIMITISRHPSASSSYTATLRNAKSDSGSKSSSSKNASSKGSDQVRASTPTTSGPRPASSSPKVSTPTPKPATSGPKTISPVPKPVPGTAKPVPGTAKPVPGTAKPVPGTAKPVPGTAKPVPGTAKLVPGTAKPVPGTAKPVPGTPKTVTPSSKTSSSGLKVASSNPKVAGPTSKPLASVSKSVTQSATPGPKTSTSAPKPVTSGSKPVISGSKPVTSGSKPLVSGPKPASTGSKTTSSGLKQPSASAKSTTSGPKLASSQSSKSHPTTSSSATVSSKAGVSSSSKVLTSSKSSSSSSSASSKAVSASLTASANTSASSKTSTAQKESSSKQSSSKTKTIAALPKLAQETSHATTRPAPLVISTAPATSPTVKSTVSPRATLSSPPLSRSNSAKSPIRSRKGSLSAVIDKLKNTASSVHVSSITNNDSVVLVSTAHVSPTTQASAAENPQVSTVSYGHTSNGVPELPAIKADVKTTKDAVKSKSSNVVTVAKAEIAVKALTTTAAITNGTVSNASDRMNSEHVSERREKSVSPTTTRQDESSETPPPLLKPQEIDPQTSLSACASDSASRSAAEDSEDVSIVTEIPAEDSSSCPASAESKTAGERPRSRGEEKTASSVQNSNGTTDERSGKKRSSATADERPGNQIRSKLKPQAEPDRSAPVAAAAMPALTAGTQLNTSALSSLVSYGDESSSSPQEISPDQAADPEPPVLEPYGKTDSPGDAPTLATVGQDDLQSLSPDGNLVIDVPGAANAHTIAPLPPATHSPDHDHSMDPEVDSQAENTSPLSDPDQSHLLYEGTSDQSQPDASPCDIDDDLMDEALIGGMDS
ncbi:MED1 [Branchiostoma lanceolatum]|uniref:Mediator of RNA polymerase II transcription subunit 1 n=1 Tax=Branchiostoma lanceolatum TaxID=7740 RepID=A0A8J9W3X3_BRALA|nr:MED1 [Branchiostoma lanceolatum]